MPILQRALRLSYLGVLPALIIILAACDGGGGQATTPPATTTSQSVNTPTFPAATTPVPVPSASVTPLPDSTSTPSTAATLTPIAQPEADISASTSIGEAPLEVAFMNLSKNADVFEWDFGDGATTETSSIDDSVIHEYTTAGTYEIILRATNTEQSSIASTATVSVTVRPGALFELKIEPSSLIASPVEEHLFTTTALDQFGNEILGLNYIFGTEPRAGEVDETGNFTAGTEAGTYSAAVSVEAAQGSVTKSVTVDITIEHGILDHILLIPETVELGIGEDQKFSATAVDAHENPISEAQIDWAIDEAAGTVANDGTLSAGTLAGTFEQGLKATVSLNGATVESTATVTVNPGPPVALSLPPIEIVAGETLQLQTSIADEYGNSVERAEVIWSVNNPNSGSISSSGLLTAGEVSGEFANAIGANSAAGALSATSPVTIIPGPLQKVVIGPEPIAIGIQMTQQFVAVGADQFGNRIADLSFRWTTESDGGAISRNGLFTAGTEPGTYTDSVRAEATHGDVTVSTVATVTVEPDRITFLSDRDNETGVLDLYVMNADGANIQRLTTGAAVLGHSWSPDGRRLAYDSVPTNDSLGIFVINDDGEWDNQISGGDDWLPAWSPGGKRIAFASTREGIADIYVMDIDGGNLSRLTTVVEADTYPAWSPDGEQIAFVSTRLFGSGLNRIWIMDSDGMNQRALTINPGQSLGDTIPSWSPAGTQMAFQSGAAGGVNWRVKVLNTDGSNERVLTPVQEGGNFPSWTPDGDRIVFHSYRNGDQADIYSMNTSGADIVRITTDEALDIAPKWAPRKRGVEVSQDSIVIPNASAMSAMTVQQVTAVYGAAVVRIETDLGSGSGFVIEPDGLILTNNHVVVDADEITVFSEDGTSYVGTVVGRDLVRDLAVVDIDAQDLSWLQIADINSLSLGSEVVVMGYPLGSSDLSVTRGLASAFKDDTGSNITRVQTDSSINPGNSGGPLLNLQGEVVGVVTSKLVGANIEGLGFAISANTVNLYLDRMKDGEVITS